MVKYVIRSWNGSYYGGRGFQGVLFASYFEDEYSAIVTAKGLLEEHEHNSPFVIEKVIIQPNV